jgi:hypothetical protein
LDGAADAAEAGGVVDDQSFIQVWGP